MDNMLFDTPLSRVDNLLSRFEDIHDSIYANDGLSPQQAIEEFVKILFVKIYDENNKGGQFSVSNIDDLFAKTIVEYQDVFDEDDKIRLSKNSISFIVNKLQDVSLLDSTQDAKGLAFQKFLSNHEKDRQGQFFTPEPVIDFCVEMMQPKSDERIIDPACGSGGFLMSAIKYVRKNEQSCDIKRFISDNVCGFDINKSILRIAKMKLLLVANLKTNVLCGNSLKKWDEMNDTYDIVLANPPFGAKIDDMDTLRKYELGNKWNKKGACFYKTNMVFNKQSTEVLFIERCLKLLREGGRMGIVLPNGNFENPSLEYLRFYIKQKAKLLSIIKLPQETFVPFGTGVKTSILFLEKCTRKRDEQYSVFFGKITRLGYQGNKNATPIYKKDSLGRIIRVEDKPVLDEDFSDVVVHYGRFKDGAELSDRNIFSVKSDNLNGRFDFDFYSPDNKVFCGGLIKGRTIRLSELCEIVKVKSHKLRNPNEIVEYVELSDVNTHSFEIINSTTYNVYDLPSRASYEIREGDIITAIAGNSVGTKKHATALVTKEYDGCICTNGFRVLRNFKIDPYYLLFCLKSEEFLKQMLMYRTGAAIPNVSDTDLANIEIYVPFNGEKEYVSAQVRKAFEYKQAFQKQLSSIELEVV